MSERAIPAPGDEFGPLCQNHVIHALCVHYLCPNIEPSFVALIDKPAV